MKMIILIIIISLLSCTRKIAAIIPACIQQKIEEIKSQPKWNPAGEIREYDYNGKKVYLISSDCCDQYITLVDEQCNMVCAPSGGITGKGDGKCKDFFQAAKEVKLIWKDDR